MTAGGADAACPPPSELPPPHVPSSPPRKRGSRSRPGPDRVPTSRVSFRLPWIPAFAGMTAGGVGAACPPPPPHARGRPARPSPPRTPFVTPACPFVTPAKAGVQRPPRTRPGAREPGVVPSPLDSRFRGNDGRGSGRSLSAAAPHARRPARPLSPPRAPSSPPRAPSSPPRKRGSRSRPGLELRRPDGDRHVRRRCPRTAPRRRRSACPCPRRAPPWL